MDGWMEGWMDGQGEGQGVHTSCDPQHSHDTDDGGVDRQGIVDLYLLQSDAHDGQQHDGQIQLVPPTYTHRHTHTSVPSTDFDHFFSLKPLINAIGCKNGNLFRDLLRDMNSSQVET